MSKTIQIKLDEFVQELESLPVTQLNKLDTILSNLANHAYDIGEYISELKEESKDYKAPLKKEILSEMTKMEKQIDLVFNLLNKITYDSKYMQRAGHTLKYVKSDLKELIIELQKV